MVIEKRKGLSSDTGPPRVGKGSQAICGHLERERAHKQYVVIERGKYLSSNM